MSEASEIRCPSSLRRLFFKLKLSEDAPLYTEDNEIQISCSDCTKTARKKDPDVVRVVHAYNFVGDLVRSFPEY